MQIIFIIRAISFVYGSSFSRLVAKGLIGIILITLCSTSDVKAQPGDLDESFGFDGKAITGFGINTFDRSMDIAIQSDGKILLAGQFLAETDSDFALARYNTDGILDTSFGNGGLVTIDFGGGDHEATALAIRPDGRIVVAGNSHSGRDDSDFALARYNVDGTLDESFGGGDGVVTTTFIVGSFDSAQALALKPNGQILVAGFSDADGTNDFALAQYSSVGNLDSLGFGGFEAGPPGRVTTDFSGSGSIDQAADMAIQADGKIVLAGSSQIGARVGFALARYDIVGNLDPGFGSGGIVISDFNGSESESANAVALQPDGKILAAGSLFTTGGDNDIALARYNPDGNLDTSFGEEGLVITDIGGTNRAFALALQSDGKIVVAGTSFTPVPSDNSDFALARYNVDGTRDITFGNDGVVITDFGGEDEVANGLAIQSDGKIVAAGHSDASGSDDFAIARYLDSVPTPTPTPSPIPTPGTFQPGDANGDGEINILDVTTILNDILGISTAPGNGDCNEDLAVNILDVTCVLNIILAG